MGNRVGALRGASLWLFEARGLALPRSLAPAGRISSPAVCQRSTSEEGRSHIS